MINVFIVDDHQIFRDGLRLLLDTAENMTVIGEATSGSEAIEKLADLQPDLILMDIQMPDENGIEVTRRIKKQFPEMIVLMLTMFEDEQSVFSAMQAGAVGYVLKGINHRDMLQTVRLAASGGAVFSPRIANRMMQWFEKMKGNDVTKQTIDLTELTQREREVLALIAIGDDNPAIAKKLTITSKTVRNYVSQILKKLAVSDRAAAADKARQAGINEHHPI